MLRPSGRTAFVLVVTALAAGMACGGATSEPGVESPTVAAPRSELIPDDELPDATGAWMDGPTDHALALLNAHPHDPRVLYLMARREQEQGNRAAAERYLWDALEECPRLASSPELPWRIRTELAILIAAAGRYEDAQAAAGIMCASPDADLTPPYLAPLIARMTTAGACRDNSPCVVAERCCREYIERMGAVAGAGMSPDELCAPIRTIVADYPAGAESTCDTMVRGYREGLEAMNLPSTECAPIRRGEPPTFR